MQVVAITARQNLIASLPVAPASSASQAPAVVTPDLAKKDIVLSDAPTDKKRLLSSISKDIVKSCRTGVDYTNNHPKILEIIQQLLGVPDTGTYDPATRKAVRELQLMLQQK